MKRIAVTLLFALILVGSTIGLASATDQDRFDSFIRKYAPDAVDQSKAFTPKVACVCLATNAPAVVVRTQVGEVVCALPTFDTDGSLIGLSPCAPYAVLGK